MKRPTILVADEFGAEGLEILRAGADVTVRTGMDEQALGGALAEGYEALIVRSATKVTAGSLEGARGLAVIGRAGIGVDNIDVDAATERGIVVMNTPDAGAITTAEHAIALLVSLARHVPAADAALKAGRWDKSRFTGVEITGKVFGVVGMGNIGRVVAARGVGLGMEVLGYDPYVDESGTPDGVRMVTLDELCAHADFVSIHVPLLDATHHLFDRERLASLKPGARLIHAARGGIVDDEALCDLLESGHLAGAALDVFEREPPTVDHRLRKLPNVVLTPHIGASTVEASRNISRAMATQVLSALTQGIVLNGVNVPRLDPASAQAAAPFLALGANLTRFLTAVFGNRVESLRVTLQGSLAAAAARPITVACLGVALQRRLGHPVTPVNAERLARQHDVRVHHEASTVKIDFQNLLRVELLIDGERHVASGTVLGLRHGRLIEVDGTVLDAIPEPPLLVTRHDDRPGVLGAIGTALGELGVNIVRMQLGASTRTRGAAWGIMNLDRALGSDELDRVRALEPVFEAFVVD
ncbi:MAG: phosphoglycerate dehydrogenase [Planctomycetes bacterium]|nr:phosphoglycerate dehydrogenase [Planctomycetota bacterium]